MANIYVRMPWYVAAFMRGRDEENQLTEWQPMKFGEYTEAYDIMARDLRYMDEARLSELCYSQKGWQNIVKGKTAGGGKIIINRDAQQWPTAREICLLCCKEPTGRQLSNDYLCIEIPKEVYYNRSVHRTNSCYALSYDGAKKLADLMYGEYCRYFTKWMAHEEQFCQARHIPRKRNVMVERFLVQFNIFVHDAAQMETLRRMSYKWESYANTKLTGRNEFAGGYANHVSEEEMAKAEDRKRKKRRLKES